MRVYKENKIGANGVLASQSVYQPMERYQPVSVLVGWFRSECGSVGEV